MPEAINFRERKYNPIDYGASPGASGGQNTAAFAAAAGELIANGGGAFVVPHGDYTLADTFQINNDGVSAKLYGSDKGSRLVFTGGMQNGTILNGRAMTCEGITMIASGAPNINQGSLLYIRGAAQLGSLFETISVRDVVLEGRPGSDPSNFLAIQNPAFARINGVGIVAFENESYGTKGNRGLYLFGDVDAVNGSAVGDFSVVGFNCYGVQTGILMSGGNGANGQQTVEGGSFTDCVIQGAETGFKAQAAGYQSPGHSWKGGHINCDGLAFDLESWAQFKISDGLFYLDAGSTRKRGFVYNNGSTQINVHDCNMLHFPTRAGVPNTGVGIWGVAMQSGGSFTNVHDNEFLGFDAGSACVYNASNGGANRAHHNVRQGQGIILAGSVIDGGGNIIV